MARRECSKYFPGVVRDRIRPWTPSYKTAKGSMFSIQGVESSDCPVATISEASKELMQRFFRVRTLSTYGISLYKPGEVPCKVADAFVILTSEENRVDNKRNDLEMQESSR